MKFLKGSKKNTINNNQALTPDGFKEIIERNWVGETFGSDEVGDPEVVGWLVGNLRVKILSVFGSRVELEVSVCHIETGKPLAIWTGWTERGRQITFENPPEGAFVVGQRVRTGMDK